MGCQASTPVAETERSNNPARRTAIHDHEVDLKSEGEKAKLVVEPGLLTAQIRRGKDGVRPGYASGGSSVASSFDEGSVDEEEVAFPHSTILGLSKLRDEMVAEGDLTKTVVRIETPYGQKIEDIYEGVHDGQILGSGVSGVVRLVTHRKTGVKYAVKCLDIGLIDSAEGLRQVRNEIFILCQLDHPNVVRIEEVYESVTEIYIVQELCVGGDLFDRLDEQPSFHYTEPQCARLVKQMLSSVRYLHSKGIIHRDLKLENFLFSSTDPDSELKMIDFGLSKHFEIGQSHNEQVGTPYTVAPEIICGAYDEKSDLWALGVITFLLLSGETPFGGLDGEDLMLVKQNIMRAEVQFKPLDAWEHVSEQCKTFVTRLLQQDPKLRPTAKEAQKDSWIQIWAKKDVKEATKLNQKTITALMNFKEQSDMQKLLSEVLSFTLLPEQIGGLRGEFEKIDTDGDGEISLAAMKRVLMGVAEGRALGALTEQEIEALFEAIQVRKSEPTIRWHEFLAAGLSQARIDDRNLRLAFDRMDSGRKGFITLANFKNLLGNSTEGEALDRIWEDSLIQFNSKTHDRITYDEFKRIMKGQPKDRGALPIAGSAGAIVAEALSTSSSTMPSAGSLSVVPEKTGHLCRPNDSDLELLEREGADSRFARIRKSKSQSHGNSSRSMWVDEEKDHSNSSGDFRNAGRAVALPGQTGGLKQSFINDLSALVSTRALYRKHREMRLAVLEASKQFDQKRRDRRNDLAAPSLIMRRGSVAPEELTDKHTKAMLEAAAKRCGRNRRLRNKTNSDVTGMIFEDRRSIPLATRSNDFGALR